MDVKRPIRSASKAKGLISPCSNLLHGCSLLFMTSRSVILIIRTGAWDWKKRGKRAFALLVVVSWYASHLAAFAAFMHDADLGWIEHRVPTVRRRRGIQNFSSEKSISGNFQRSWLTKEIDGRPGGSWGISAVSLSPFKTIIFYNFWPRRPFIVFHKLSECLLTNYIGLDRIAVMLRLNK